MTDLCKAAEMALDWFEGCQVNGIDDTHEAAVAAAEALRQALAQLDQKPVAWMTHTNNLQPLFHKTRASALNWQLQPTPLYTAPPISDYHEGWEEGFKAAKKEWVGLTDDERSYYLQSAANVGWWQAALFVEAKLKEKNT